MLVSWNHTMKTRTWRRCKQSEPLPWSWNNLIKRWSKSWVTRPWDIVEESTNQFSYSMEVDLKIRSYLGERCYLVAIWEGGSSVLTVDEGGFFNLLTSWLDNGEYNLSLLTNGCAKNLWRLLIRKHKIKKNLLTRGRKSILPKLQTNCLILKVHRFWQKNQSQW